MIMYGMGPASLAATIKGTIQDAQKIIDDFYKEFPNVKKWIDETYRGARENGYVTDFWGRKRRLPDIKLPPYEIIVDDEKTFNDFNPLLYAMGASFSKTSPKRKKYEQLLADANGYRGVEKVKSIALGDGVTINDNTGFISRAERQCVNARVQGGAATMSKKAMIRVHNDDILKSLGFRLLLAVHDELIGECPEENADAVAERLCNIMKMSALPECQVPFKCDATIEKVWYYTDYSDIVREKYNELLKNMGVEEAFNTIWEEKCELTKEQLISMLNIS